MGKFFRRLFYEKIHACTGDDNYAGRHLLCGRPERQAVRDQVTTHLNSLRPASWANFPDYFELRSVIVKDKMIGSNEGEIIVEFTVRFKQLYKSGSDAMMAFGDVVRQQGKVGDLAVEESDGKIQEIRERLAAGGQWVSHASDRDRAICITIANSPFFIAKNKDEF